MGFEMPDSIIFPKPVVQNYTSREFMDVLDSYSVPKENYVLWFLGQNCFIIKTPEQKIIVIDPYLTDFCASGRTGEPVKKSRLLPVFIEPEDLQADMVLLTHSHCDHTDPWTIERYQYKDSTEFLAPFQSVPVLRKAGVPGKAITLMHPKQEYLFFGTKITGTFAEPTDGTDLNHMGYLLEFSNGKSYYNTGDTAQSDLLRNMRKKSIDCMSICINGGYHNLSHWEAAEVAGQIKPKTAVPCHFDMMPHNVQPPHMFAKSLDKHDPEIEYLEMEYTKPYLF
ncbi:MAG: MBL fold metallo-hydrolase [Spirochaetia bacterium]